MEIHVHEGDRAPLGPLFALADESPQRVAGYRDSGTVLVAREDGRVVGHLQLVDRGQGVAEVTSTAVVADRRAEGVGRALMEEARRRCRADGVATLLVATAAADTGNLRYYQRLGFRFRDVERDAFVPATGYVEAREIDGIPLRDRIWFDREP